MPVQILLFSRVTELRSQLAVIVVEAFMYWSSLEKQSTTLIYSICIWILEDLRVDIYGTAPHSHR